MLSKYGIDNIIVMAIIATILLALSIRFFNGQISNNILSIILFVYAVALYLLTFWFFRDPDRTLPTEAHNNSAYVISPADGLVTEIVTEYEKHYLKSESKRITIFLSPLDVHVNRIPVTGKVEFVNYQKGKFIIASKPDASEINEQSHFGVLNDYGKVFFKQIVGILARRVVYDIKVNDEVKAGDRFGMMKFGSRMDIALPLDTEIHINVGDRVKAGETIIAILKKTD